MRLHATCSSVFFSALITACSAAGGNTRDAGLIDPNPHMDGGMSMREDSGRVIRDAGRIDPFDPDSGCGSDRIPTERVPGQLLLVFDRSGSMREAPNGEDATSRNPSKWDRSRNAIQSVLASVSDDLGMGLMLFPTGEGSECDPMLSANVPQVPVAPLATNRARINSTLSGASPSGGVTPIFDAVRAGYDYLDTLTGAGQRGLVVVTDGAENCDDRDRDAVMAQVAAERENNDYLTYVVGLTTSNSDLSTMAFNGGTPRNDTCLPECTTPVCLSNADCPGGNQCAQPLAGFPGMCACTTNADCPAPLRCEALPFPFPGLPPAQCSGTPNCCHYDASASSFQPDFEAALQEIARRFLDSCVFDLPRGSDPTMFDPALVNVGVTFEGESRTVLFRGSDPNVSSWDFTSGEHRSIVIQGPICDRLLNESANVEIVLGCPTILI
jgi:hypothetical protein